MQRCRRLRDASHQLLAIPACVEFRVYLSQQKQAIRLGQPMCRVRGSGSNIGRLWPGFQGVVSRSSASTRGEASGDGPTSTLCHERRAHFSTEPPHPVPGCVLEVLVLLVTTLHQSGECVVVELVAAALFLALSSEAAAAIRAFFLAVVNDALAKLRRIRIFFMWRDVFLDVALCT